MKKNHAVLLFCIFLLMILLPVHSTGWYNTTYSDRINITLQTGASSFNYTYLILLNSTITGSCQSDLDDLLFVYNENTVLNHEIENFTTSNATIWLETPDLPASSTYNVSLYFNSPTAIKSWIASQVWDINYTTVQHMDEQDGTWINDSSASNMNFSIGGSLGFDANCIIGRCMNNTGTGYGVTARTHTYVANEPMTLEAWVYPTATSNNYNVIMGSAQNGVYERGVLGSGYNGATADKFFSHIFNQDLFTSNAHGLGTWYYIAYVYNGTNQSIYLNGTLLATSPGISTTAQSIGMTLFRWYTGYDDFYYYGRIDEARFSNLARTPDYLNLNYQNVMNYSNIVSFGSVETHAYSSMNITLVTPTANANFTRNAWNQFTVNVSCSGADCGSINITLDPSSWIYPAWAYRKELIINHAKISGNMINWTIPIFLTSANFNFSRAQANGEDIRFADNTTALNYEIEYWNATEQKAYIWVEIYNSNRGLYIYYGNAGAVDNQNATAIWSDYLVVLHMKELSGIRYDSTSNKYDFVEFNDSYPVLQTIGAIGNGTFYSNGTNKVRLYNHTLFSTGTYADRTYEIWFKTEQVKDENSSYEEHLFAKQGVYGYYDCAWFSNQTYHNTGSWAYCVKDGAVSYNIFTTTKYWSNTTFYYLVSECGAQGMKIYVNGTLEGSAPSNTSCITTGNWDEFYLGGWSPGQYANYNSFSMNGTLDEFRVSTSQRSDQFVQNNYQAMINQILTAGAEQDANTTKVIISTVNGTLPFWTNTSNPLTISLNAGQSQLVTFWVNATGNANETYEFYAIAEELGSDLIINFTNRINITIVSGNVTGNVTSLLCNVSTNATYENQTMSLDCDLNISSGIKVILNNVSLIMNNAFDYQYGINNSGILQMNNGSIYSNGYRYHIYDYGEWNLTNMNDDNQWNFTTFNGSKVYMKNTNLTNFSVPVSAVGKWVLEGGNNFNTMTGFSGTFSNIDMTLTGYSFTDTSDPVSTFHCSNLTMNNIQNCRINIWLDCNSFASINNSVFSGYGTPTSGNGTLILENTVTAFEFEFYGGTSYVKNSTDDHTILDGVAYVNFTKSYSTLGNLYIRNWYVGTIIMQGYVDVGTVNQFVAGKVINRTYPAIIRNASLDILSNTSVYIKKNSIIYDNQTTDSSGFVWLTAIFNVTNYNDEFEVWTTQKIGNVTLALDTKSELLFNESNITIATVTIQLPTNTTYNHTNGLNLSYTTANTDRCWYHLDSGINISLTSCANITFNTTEGWHKLYVHVNNTAGTNATENISFTVDTTAPQLILVSTTVYYNYNTSVPLNYTIQGAFDKCWYNIDGGSNIVLATCTNTTLGLLEGSHIIRIYVNDSVNNTNSSILTMVIDLTDPALTIQNPTASTYTYTNGLLLNFTITELYTDSCWYNLDNGTNTSLASCGNTTFNIALPLASTDTSHIIIVYVNDSAGNVEEKNVTFQIHLSPPTGGGGGGGGGGENISFLVYPSEINTQSETGTKYQIEIFNNRSANIFVTVYVANAVGQYFLIEPPTMMLSAYEKKNATITFLGKNNVTLETIIYVSDGTIIKEVVFKTKGISTPTGGGGIIPENITSSLEKFLAGIFTSSGDVVGKSVADAFTEPLFKSSILSIPKYIIPVVVLILMLVYNMSLPRDKKFKWYIWLIAIIILILLMIAIPVVSV